MADTKIIDRVRKLLALGNSPNENEAKLALERASELMTKYQLEMSDVDVAGVKRSGVVREDYTVPNLKMKYHWVVTLAQACATLYDGQVLNFKDLHGTRVAFVGTADDVTMMKQTFEYLWQSWSGIVEADLDEAKSMNTTAGRPFAPRDTMKFKLGHGQQFAYRLYVRCTELAYKRQAAVNKTTTGTSLVLVKSDLIREYNAANNIRKTKTKQTSGSSLGREYGEKRGREIPLGGAIAAE